MQYTNVIERVPVGVCGSVEVVHDEPSHFERMHGAMRGMPLTRAKYARLLIGGSVMMTDAEFERRTNAEFMLNAHGDVLIGGLGIGLILDPCIAKCSSVTVVENNPNVIKLVAPSFPAATIVHDDINTWIPAPGKRYDTIYFDIWPHFNEDMAAEARSLHKRFRKYLRTGGWMRSWCVLASRAGRSR